MEVLIRVNENIELRAILYETETAEAIFSALPLTARGDTWGEEIYFDSGVKAPSIDPKEVLEAGDLAYWPPMSAICIFYGPTPASRGDEIRAAGPVSVFGKIQEGNLEALKKLQGSVSLTLEKV